MAEIFKDMDGFDSGQLAQLEEAAVLLMSASNVSKEQRSRAEELFMKLRNEKIPPELCCFLIESTSNEFVMFEMVQVMVMSLFKNWQAVEETIVKKSFQYFLENAVNNGRLTQLVKKEMLRSVAKLVKRSVFDSKACTPETLKEAVCLMLGSEDSRVQILACELVGAIANEFSSSWRASNFGITFDFHVKARRAFESNGLQQLFENCIHSLSDIVLSADISSSHQMSLCENFLRVAVIVLSWDFETRRFPVRSSFSCGELTPSAVVCPPASWKPLFQSDDFFSLFFELHKRLRYNESLCSHTMNCLVQLASVIGPVLLDDNGRESQFIYDHYIGAFLTHFLETFTTQVLEDETLLLCSLVYKLMTYHKLPSFARNESLFKPFVNFLLRFVEYFVPIAMRKALVDDDLVYLEGIQRLYDTWWIIVRNDDRINKLLNDKINFDDFTESIVNVFIRTILSEPLGCRVQIPDQECDENGDDDRQIFEKVLEIVANHTSLVYDRLLPQLHFALETKVREMVKYVESGVSEADLTKWREDMHWLLLYLGHALTYGDECGGSRFRGELADHEIEDPQLSIVDGELVDYINNCINAPHSFTTANNINPVFRLFGLVLSWLSIEHQLLLGHNPFAASPELTRSSLWCANRFIVSVVVEEQLLTKPTFNLVTQAVINFTLQKVFTIFKELSGEKELCMDAVNILASLAQTKAMMVANSELFLTCLASISLETLPVRRTLLKALSQLSTSTDDADVRNKVAKLIFLPISERFSYICKSRTCRESDIIDLMDCLCGIVEASNRTLAQFLFEYIKPVLPRVIELMSVYKESQPITSVVLDLFKIISKKIGIYSDKREDIQYIYETVLELLRVYQRGQFSRYHVVTVDNEEQVEDLMTLIEMLSDIISRDVINVDEATLDAQDYTRCSAYVSLVAFEMLIPVMNDELLKFPTLCLQFYRFIWCFSELAPHYLVLLSGDKLAAVFECLRHGLLFDFGDEVASTSAMAVNELACYVSKFGCRNEQAHKGLSSLIPAAFSMCLSGAWQMELQNHSSAALFSLICYSKEAFDGYVTSLLSRPENVPSQGMLQSAFEALIPPGTDFSPNRHERKKFRYKFEEFVMAVQGSLVID